MRLLVLCTHNSARSQMAEGWLRHYANEVGLETEVFSAGTEQTFVKPDAVTVMNEVGIDLSNHSSKTLHDLPDPWTFDVVVTVCDSANETCPAYPAETTRLHVSFPDPSGESLDTWREVRDALREMSERLVSVQKRGETPTEEAIRPADTRLAGGEEMMKWCGVSLVGILVSVAWSQSYDVGGSSTVYPISLAMVEEFSIENPGAEFIVRVNGTGGGFAKFCAGDYPLTGASRPIKPEEMETCAANGVDFVELPIAFDALTIAVSPNVTFTDCLSTDQLKQLFEPDSAVQAWQDLDPSYPDEPVTFFVPGLASGTYNYFTETLVDGESRTDVLASEDDGELVTGLIDTPSSIGYFGYAYYLESEEEIKALSVDSGDGCVAPSTEAILDGSYTPLSRPLFIYVNGSALEDENVAALAELYLAEDSRFLIEETGYALLPEEAYDLARARLEKRVTGSTFQDFTPGMQVVNALE